MNAPSSALSITSSNAQPMLQAMHATQRTYATNERVQDSTGNTHVPDAPNPVDNTYIELPADHDFTAFLASLTPSKVLRDREANFSRVERKRARYLVEPKRIEDSSRRAIESALAENGEEK